MGSVYADIEIINSDDTALANSGYIKENEVRRTNVKAMVDSVAYMMAINEEIRDSLV